MNPPPANEAEQAIGMEYGYEPEQEQKNWFDLIVEYLRQKKAGQQPKLARTV